jgi:dienelactone hydrolase
MMRAAILLLLAAALAATGAEVRDIRYGTSRSAYLVTPSRGGPASQRTGPGVLFLHWYDPSEPTSNRTQFLGDAVELANDGFTSLLVETMWSSPEWFRTRDRARDLAASQEQIADLRRALEFLRRQPGVDPKRVAVVGHDFGGMYGPAMASVAGADKLSVQAWVIMAATPRFGDWFTLGWKLTPEERPAIVARTESIDPIRHVGALSPAPVLFQFARKDPFVSEERAREFFDAAREPKEIRWYEGGHSLNMAAAAERLAWLREKLRR